MNRFHARRGIAVVSVISVCVALSGSDGRSDEPDQRRRDGPAWSRPFESVDSDPSCRLHLLASSAESRAAFGFDLATRGILPGYLSCESRSSIVALDVEEAWLCGDGERYPSLALDDAIDIARASYDAAILVTLFGSSIVGSRLAQLADEKNQSIDQVYHAAQFRPKILNPRQSAEGLVFFSIPPRTWPAISSASLPMRNLERSETFELELGGAGDCSSVGR